MKYSSLVNRIAGTAADAWAVNREANKRKAEGRDVIVLSVGDHEFDTSAGIIGAAERSLANGRHHYSDAAGEVNLREAIVRHHRRTTGQAIDIDNIVVYPGAQAGLFAAGLCLFDAGDEVIIPEPMYATYEATIRSSGADIVPLPLSPEQGFQIDADALQAAITPRTKGLLLNTPHNPTGAMFGRDTLQGVADVCVANDLWVLSDEVYATMTYDAPHISPVSFPQLCERTVVISSMSKSHAMTGWRVGWVIAEQELAEHLENLSGCMLFGLAPFLQDAAAWALDNEQENVVAICDMYRRRRDELCSRLEAIPPLRLHRPEGSMFLMLDVRATDMNAQDFAWQLLEAQGVAVMPGDSFGAAGAGHVRLSLSAADDELERACDRIAEFLKPYRN